MIVTLLPIVIEVKLEQPEKAEEPMLVTLLGSSTEVKLEQPEKAEEPMLVTLLGMVVFWQPVINILLSLSMIALQLSLESYLELLGATTIEVKLEQ